MIKIHFDQIGGREVPQMCQRSGMLVENMDQGPIFQGTVSPGSNVDKLTCVANSQKFIRAGGKTQ